MVHSTKIPYSKLQKIPQPLLFILYIIPIGLGKYGVRSCNITKDILYWPHDQTITDRICKEQFITSSPEEMPKR
jgi:hypothetical protein